MAKIKVLMLGPARTVKGGVSSVVNNLYNAGIDREVVFFDGMEYPFSVDNQFMHVTQGQYMMGAMAVKTLNKIFKGEEVPAKRYIPYNIVMKDKD